MSWQQGHETIAQLLAQGRLEHLSGQAANGQYLIVQARQRLSSAITIAALDPGGAYNLAYEAIRQAATALLVQQGLRPKIEGGHVAVADAVIAQFGEPFGFFNAMRRRRNRLEYPHNSGEAIVDPDAVNEAIAYVERTVEAVEELLPQLVIWR